MSDLVATKKPAIEGEIVGSRPSIYPLPDFRKYNPYPELRALGYINNPDTCKHRIKGYTPKDGWWCKECGTEFREMK